MVFLFRDFDDDDLPNIQYYNRLISDDLLKLWDNTPISARVKKGKFGDSFNIFFFPLPSFKTQRLDFSSKIEEIKNFFQKIMKNRKADADPLPGRDLEKLMKNIWKGIQDKKVIYI